MANPFEQSVDEAYNPFAMNSSYNEPDTSMDTKLLPAEQPNTYDYPQTTQTSENSQNTQFKDSVTGLNLDEKTLAEREAALAKREQIIANREREVNEARANGTLSQLNPHPRNFPILFHFYKYYPEEELPTDSLPFMKKLMWLFYIAGGILAYNVLCAFFCLAPGPSSKIKSAATSIVFSIFYMCACFPLSLELCFFVFYNALKQGKGIKYVGAIISLSVYTIFFIYLAVGWGDFGSIGWISTINIFGADSNTWVGILSVIYSILATLCSVAMGFMVYYSIRYFKTHDLQRKAVGEAAGMAAQYASDHKEEIIDAAKSNPEVAMQAASFAANQTTYT